MTALRFNPPPGWPTPPAGWTPPTGWTPDPAWPTPPDGWQLWLPDDEIGTEQVAEFLPSPVSTQSTMREDVEDRHLTDGDDRAKLIAWVAELERKLALIRSDVRSDIVELDDQRMLQEVGIYRYHHPLENAALYRERLANRRVGSASS